MGIWLHNPDITVGLYIWKGIIPAGLGNIIGGALFVAAYYYGMYIFRQPPIVVDGVAFETHEKIDAAEKGLGDASHHDRVHSDRSSQTGVFKEADTAEVRRNNEIGG